MRSAKSFLQNYLKESAVRAKRDLDDYALFCKKYYDDNYEPARRRLGRLANLVASKERILSASKSGTVVTEKSDGTNDNVKVRYKLIKKDNTWLINSVHLACPRCDGAQDNPECKICRGDGWHEIFKIRPEISPRQNASRKHLDGGRLGM